MIFQQLRQNTSPLSSAHISFIKDDICYESIYVGLTTMSNNNRFLKKWVHSIFDFAQNRYFDHFVVLIRFQAKWEQKLVERQKKDLCFCPTIYRARSHEIKLPLSYISVIGSRFWIINRGDSPHKSYTCAKKTWNYSNRYDVVLPERVHVQKNIH